MPNDQSREPVPPKAYVVVDPEALNAKVSECHELKRARGVEDWRDEADSRDRAAAIEAAGVGQEVVFETVTREEVRAELDRAAQEALGISGEDFMQRLRSGDLDNSSPTVSRLAVLARLLTPEPTVPDLPRLRLDDWLRWRVLRFSSQFGWAMRHVRRARCARCGDRPVYSWKGKYWPREWLCKSCSLDPDRGLEPRT